MPWKRFVLFWILDYLIAWAVVYTIASAAVPVFNLPLLAYTIVIFVPISTMCFSWFFYNGVYEEKLKRSVMALVWVVPALVVDLAISQITSSLTVWQYVGSPIVLGVILTKFLAVLVGAKMADWGRDVKMSL